MMSQKSGKDDVYELKVGKFKIPAPVKIKKVVPKKSVKRSVKRSVCKEHMKKSMKEIKKSLEYKSLPASVGKSKLGKKDLCKFIAKN